MKENKLRDYILAAIGIIVFPILLLVEITRWLIAKK
tara:strand:- start:402 stop:509 length:108 start_codon:yes stop_codon:yes gene_type:complete